ncbi:hypothetical protein L1987_65270 [Smallanthus sonchifolius]|uniref:Uncharacterized protein n=1 Tax=Smallanthus sonchifolius TaxID=185202 RepID=A0ACB9BU19_9ASTR|nr:hypothetical protein L1987_65270 [Smallanthus sonchifolius]
MEENLEGMKATIVQTYLTIVPTDSPQAELAFDVADDGRRSATHILTFDGPPSVAAFDVRRLDATHYLRRLHRFLIPRSVLDYTLRVSGTVLGFQLLLVVKCLYGMNFAEIEDENEVLVVV